MVTDASGNTASAILTVLGTPTITLAAAQGISGVGTVGITGTGFTPGLRAASVQILQGSTVVASNAQTASPITVSATGTITATTGETFTVPSANPGVYTVMLTLSLPTESASSAFTILGSPTLTTSVTSATPGVNVTVTIVGITAVGTATLGATLANLLGNTPATFGSTVVPTTGANAYSLTTWFIVPQIPGGPYTLLLSDGVRSAQETFTIATSITLTPTTGILKGSTVNIAGSGFATAGTAFTVTVNGVAITAAAGTTGAGGTVTTAFSVPVTATASNTVVVTDVSGNTATKTFALTNPTLIATPASGTAGSTVQLIGSGYVAGSQIVVLIGGIVVTTSPATVTATGGSFIAYATIPAGLSGSQTITAIDTSNNMGTATFTVTAGSGATFTVNQAALSSTAQTLNSAGSPATSFPRGSSVKFSFVLDTTTGSGSVVWRITLQQGTAVYNIATTTASISTTPTTLTFTQLIPTGVAAGTWTATIQIYASDGVTPLGVTTLTFTAT